MDFNRKLSKSVILCGLMFLNIISQGFFLSRREIWAASLKDPKNLAKTYPSSTYLVKDRFINSDGWITPIEAEPFPDPIKAEPARDQKVYRNDQVYKNNGYAHFELYQELQNVETNALALGDMDRDNDDDLFTASPDRVYIYRNNNQGYYLSNYLSVVNPKDLKLGDIDKDQDLDLAIVLPNSCIIFKNDGYGSFTKETSFAVSEATCLDFGDLDKDNDLDLAIGTYSGYNLFKNDGNGNFAYYLSFGTTQVTDLWLMDIDRDSDVDLVAAHIGDNHTYLNDGSSFIHWQAWGSYSTRSIFLMDINRDFYPDVVEANDGINKVYLNVSGKFFEHETNIGGGNTNNLVLGDLNRDNIPDLVTANDGVNRVYIGNGEGNFTDAGENLGDYGTSSVGLTDIDKDGDLDIIFGNRTITSVMEFQVQDGRAPPGGSDWVDLTLDNDVEVSGIQFKMNYECNFIHATTARLTTRSAAMQILYNIEEDAEGGFISVVIYSLAGKWIAEGEGSVLQVNFEVDEDATGGSLCQLILEDVFIVDQDGNNLNVKVINGNFIVEGEDSEDPYTWGHNPAKGATNVPVDTSITVEISDTGLGVDESSINIKVQDQTVTPVVTGSPVHYTVTYDPANDFPCGETVNVAIEACDLSDPPNCINTDTYYFSTADDNSPPIFQNLQPANGDTGVDISTNIYLEILDSCEGVDPNSVKMKVQFHAVTPDIAPISNGYAVTYNPTENFNYKEIVFVYVEASDYAGNLAQLNYTFTILAAQALLQASDSEASPSDPAMVTISLANQVEVARLQFSLAYNGDLLSISTPPKKTLRTEQMQTYYNAEDDAVAVFLFKSGTSEGIKPGTGAILELTFNVSPSAPIGASCAIAFTAVALLDENGLLIPSTFENGVFEVTTDSDPVTSGHIPAQAAKNVNPYTFIYLRITDPQGVDANTVAMTVEGIPVQTQIGYIENGVSVLYQPGSPFAYNQKVEVTVDACDNDSVPHCMTQESYNFTTLATADLWPPYTDHHEPTDGDQNVPINTNIYFQVWDKETGVNANSIKLKVNQQEVTTNKVSIDGIWGFAVTYNPAQNFEYGEEVEVAIEACDLFVPKNCLSPVIYHFTTLPYPDLNPPYTTNHNPPPDAENVEPDTNIYVEIRDHESGVDLNAISMKVNGLNVQPQTHQLNNPKGYSLLYEPLFNFDSNEIVTVQINGCDQAEPPNCMLPNVYSFTIIGNPDYTPPYCSNHNPAKNAQGVPQNTLISLQIADSGAGVDAESIKMYVEDELVEPQLTTIYNGFKVIYDPPQDYDFAQEVQVLIEACDLAYPANCLTPDLYSFTIVESPSCILSAPYTSGAPGELIPVDISLNNEVPVFGVQFDLNFEPSLLSVTEVEKSNRTSNLNLSWLASSNSVTVLLYSTSGNNIAIGSGAIVGIDFQIDQAASGGMVSPLNFSSVFLSDNNGNQLSTMISNGSMTITGQDSIPPLITNQDPAPNQTNVAPDTDVYLELIDPASGVNVNSISLSINDEPVDYQIDPLASGYSLRWLNDSAFTLGQTVQVKVSACDLAAPPNCLNSYSYSFTIYGQGGNWLSVPDAGGSPGQSVTIPLNLDNEDLVGGIQLTLEYDDNLLYATDFEVTERTDNFTISWNQISNAVILILISTTGDTINLGSGAIIQMSFNVNSQAQTGQQTTLLPSQVYLVDPNGLNLPFEASSGIFSVLP